MKKFDKIKRIGHKQNQGMLEEGRLVIKEKLDGSNFRFTVTEVDGEYNLLFGSRNVEYKIDGVPDYAENVASQFEQVVQDLREKLDAERIAKLYGTEYTFFGENMVKHSLEYDWGDTPQFIGFDVHSHEEGRYLSTDEAFKIFETLGLETAPIVARVPADNFDAEEFDPAQESRYRDGAAEGVVIINEDMDENGLSGFNTRGKMVTEEFKEKHEQSSNANHSGGSPQGAKQLRDKYCTDARIKKHVNKMLEEDYDLGMELMSPDNGDGLYMRVAHDIVDEEPWDVMSSSWTIDFKEFRNLVAGRCAMVLKRKMQGEAS